VAPTVTGPSISPGAASTGDWSRGRPTTVTVPHRVARSMLVDLDPEVALNAFFTGEIRVEGDITRLMELTQSNGAMLAATPEQLAFIGELRELTQ
jgi:hypothetical protein